MDRPDIEGWITLLASDGTGRGIEFREMCNYILYLEAQLKECHSILGELRAYFQSADAELRVRAIAIIDNALDTTTPKEES